MSIFVLEFIWIEGEGRKVESRFDLKLAYFKPTLFDSSPLFLLSPPQSKRALSYLLQSEKPKQEKFDCECVGVSYTSTYFLNARNLLMYNDLKCHSSI